MARLFRTCKALQLDIPSSSSSSSSSSTSFVTSNPGQKFRLKVVAGKPISTNQERKVAVVSARGSVSETVETEKETKNGVDLLTCLVNDVAGSTLKIFKPLTKGRSWKLKAEVFLERIIINCRFFTLIGVAGSLLGSILCFMEGCFLILESFSEYFHGVLKRPEQGELMQLLIEAIDMFMIGTAMLIFGMGLYVLFISSREMKGRSHFFGMFHLKKLPAWVEMETVAQAKSKIGHAVVMILQVGVLEKFKMVPLTTGLDLACFAGAILVSSACIFLLSRLSIQPGNDESWFRKW